MSTTPGITLHNITLHTLGSGRGITVKGQGGLGGDITLTYNEFVPGGGGPTGFNFEDGSGTGTGIVINSVRSGVLMGGLTAPNIAFVAANLPDSGPGGSGEIWTAHWSAGSTYSTTPVAIYYSSTGPGGQPVIVFWVLDPSDGTYHTGTAGTFNFPMSLTAGTTPTSFTN
jgi:hypothetical protein